jgi:hypothetical protein
MYTGSNTHLPSKATLGKMFQLVFIKFRLVKHNILALNENTIIAHNKFAFQKMPLKDE